MAEDLIAIVETELARALRAVDAACTVGAYLEKHPPEGSRGEKARETARRALKVREVLLAAGFKLPQLRKIGEYGLREDRAAQLQE
jgi:hypothetical protein